MAEHLQRHELPAGHLDAAKMPGHWLLARLGKRVLRPGGRELTRRMLDGLDVGNSDDVVEFAPGLGETARWTLSRNPASYTAVDRDAAAAELVRRTFTGANRRCVIASAEATGLEDASASVVYGEAMLSMQTPARKTAIVREAFRVLRPGGRYAIHELCLGPGNVPEETRDAVRRDLSGSVHVGVRPLTVTEWRELLESEGFTVEDPMTAPMHLLEPARMIQDEGVGGAARIAWNMVRDREARGRVLEMRRSFRRHADHLCAISLIARRPSSDSAE
ncbi:MAG: methyltransferase domain-containing protein [Planctomycetota bacterium]